MSSDTGTVLLGVALGGALTILSNVTLEWIKRRARTEQLAHAIAGEVSAVIGIAEARGYLSIIEHVASQARLRGWAQLSVSAKHNYFATIEANLDSIGLLPAELPILIPRFLTLSKAAMEDFASLSEATKSSVQTSDDMSGAELVQRLDELAAILLQARDTGRQIILLVAAFYGSPHGRIPIEVRVRRLFRRPVKDERPPDTVAGRQEPPAGD